MAGIFHKNFNGLDSFPKIKQDKMALMRACLFGKTVADRDFYRATRPGMRVDDVDRIESADDRKQYAESVKLLQNISRTESTQFKHTGYLANQLRVNINSGFADLPRIADALGAPYRLIVFRYHPASGICTLEWASPRVGTKPIHLVTDGHNWNCLTSTYGVFEGKYFCSYCLKTSVYLTRHRCEYKCSACDLSLMFGKCIGGPVKTCKDCNFTFLSESCYERHRDQHQRGNSTLLSRCARIKSCPDCLGCYRTSNGEHVCGESIFCTQCQEYTVREHDCHWKELSTKKRNNMREKQARFRFAFYDIESVICTEPEPQVFRPTQRHYASTIVLRKVCYDCADRGIDDPCNICGTREEIFTYGSGAEFSADENGPYRVIDRFCEYLLREPTMRGRSIYGHNAARYDSHIVINGLIRKGVAPKIINKGSDIVNAVVQLRGGDSLCFKDSYLLIPMALGQFNKAFELNCEDKGTFPFYVNTPQHWGKVWPSLPPLPYYDPDHKKPEERKRLIEWHNEESGREWVQDEEIVKYCRQDVIILLKGCLRFRTTMLESTGWCPFTNANTLASFCQWLLRADHLPAEKMPYLPESGYGAHKHSILAMQYIRWLEHLRDANLPSLVHARSSRAGEMAIHINHHRTLRVDCYDPATNTVIEILGCYYHGCPKCFPRGSMLVGGESAISLYKRTMDRLELIKDKGYTIEGVWECEIKRMMKKNAAMNTFFKEIEIVDRLKVRDALYGGRVEVMRTYLKKTVEKSIRYYDIVSLYPAVMALRSYPLGQPEIIIEPVVTITNNKLPWRGLIKVRVLPPTNLPLAVLPFPFEGGLFFPLCAKCAKEHCQECDHTDDERSWVGTFTTIEVEEALAEGYKILKVHEVWSWSEWSEDLYKPYFKTFMKMKYAASGWPAGVVTDADKAAYCRKVGLKLGFTLTPDEVAPSAARRTVAKLCNNSAWGKLAQKIDRLSHEILNTADLINTLRDSSKVVTNIVPIETSKMHIVSHRQRVETIRASRYSAVHHAAFVTSYARVLIRRIVKRAGEGAAYMDTDSVVFEMDTNGPDPMADILTDELGDLSDEVKEGWEIDECVFAGCKNYSMRLVNPSTNEVDLKQAIRGIRRDTIVSDLLTHDRVRDMVLKQAPSQLVIERPQLRREIGRVYSTTGTWCYKPVSRKRVNEGEGEVMIKRPHGFHE